MTADLTALAALGQHAARQPAQPAVIAGSTTVTYAELDQAVTRRAGALTAAGLGPGRVLAVALGNGPAAIVALLASLRVGTTLTWLDPGLPGQRRTSIVDDCRPAAVLHDRRPAEPHLEVLDGAVPAVADDVAYLVYTSGSTGAPKGIMQPASNIEQVARWLADDLGLRPGARLLQWSRMSYDAAYTEILGAIHAGATLVVPAAQDSVATIAGLMATERITHLQAVPSLWRAALEASANRPAGPAAPLADLRVVGLFGEPLDHELIAATRRRAPAAAVRNYYGPTECVLATVHHVGPTTAGGPVPIGRPIPGRQIELRDRDGLEVADGAVGEIWIRSRYLAFGYRNDAVATAQAFRPGDRGDGARLYRTGDLGYRLPDGSLVFAGRDDDQVKVRGARVELGEIEATLRRQPNVFDAAVTVQRTALDQVRLVACLVPAGTGQPDWAGQIDVDAVHQALVRALPTYMLPAEYRLAAQLPRTHSGKVDRPALLALAPPEPEGADHEAPATETEQRLAALWQQLLELPTVSRHDDFFAVGGRSLLAPELAAAVGEAFGADLPVLALFENPTLAKLARLIDNERLGTGGT